MGIGGSSANGLSSSPTTMFVPVAFGGNINAGDIGNGAVSQTGSSEGGGGEFGFKLDIPMPKAPKLQLQNLDWMSDFGNGLSQAAKYGSQAYKIGKDIAPTATGVFQQFAPENYEKYVKPAGETFMTVKEAGKSAGGWKAVDQFGNSLSGNPSAPAEVAPTAAPTADEEFQQFLAWKAAQGKLILLQL